MDAFSSSFSVPTTATTVAAAAAAAATVLLVVVAAVDQNQKIKRPWRQNYFIFTSSSESIIDHTNKRQQ